MNLLTRNDFRDNVFKRDNFCCVICGNKATAAHHIIDRVLFNDGGYYLSNGSSLCDVCHIKAEQTLISCQEIRDTIGIKDIILPDYFYSKYNYTKWGDILLSDGLRIPGPLYKNDNVQKILKQGKVIQLYENLINKLRNQYI